MTEPWEVNSSARLLQIALFSYFSPLCIMSLETDMTHKMVIFTALTTLIALRSK